MKKLTIASLALFFGVSVIAFAVSLDEWTEVEWNYNSRKQYTRLNDGNMAGLQDSSILYRIPDGAGELVVTVFGDTGSTSILIADNDSFLLWANLIPYGGTYANAVLFDGVADSLIAAADADSFGSWGLGFKTTYVPDTFFYPIYLPPPDTAGGSAALRLYGQREPIDNAYIGFRVRVTDSTGIGGNTRVYFKFVSRANSWDVSGHKGYSGVKP